MSTLNVVVAVFFLVLTGGAFLAIKHYQPPPAAVEEADFSTDDLHVFLRRTGCFGTCPVYALQVQGSGDVRFVGEEYTETNGEVLTTVDEDGLFLIAVEIERSNFFEYKEVDECIEAWTDSPSVELGIEWHDRERRVQRYLGCEKAPPDPVPELAHAIDEIIGTARWIGDGEKHWP